MKNIYLRLFCVVLTLTILTGLFPGISVMAEPSTTEIYGLRINDLTEPMGIDDPSPSFSWKMKSNATGVSQTAYSITVSDGSTNVWNSGWVESDNSIGIDYAGSPLTQSTRYTVSVSVKDNSNNTMSAESSFETGLMGNVSDAKWISLGSSTGNTNSLPAFRKSFTPKTLKSAKLYTSALGVYDAFINGQRVGKLLNDGTVEYHELKPGYTEPQKRKFYSSYDITQMLKPGEENVLSAEVSSGWWSGAVVGFAKGTTDAFWAKLILTYTDGTTETIVTDTTWKTSRQSPVQKTSGIFPGEKYDARISTNWQLPGFDDSIWKNATVNNEFTGELVTYDGEYVTVRKDLERIPQDIYVYDGVTGAVADEYYGKVNIARTYKDGDTITLNPGETLVVDFGQNFAGWEAFDVVAETGTTIHVEHGEILNESNGEIARGADGPEGSVYNQNYRSNIANTDYITAGIGTESYHPRHTYYGFRCIGITADKPATFTNIRGQVVTSVKEDTASMTTSNNDVNQLLSNITWSMYSNYLSVPTDCPQRTERMGWTGDAQIFAETGSYLGNNKSFMEKYLTDMRDVQVTTKDHMAGEALYGAFSTIAPTGSYQYKNSSSSFNWGDMGWADAGVIIPYYLYMMYGDTKTLQEHWDAMVLYVDEYLGSTNGLGGRKTFADHMHYERNDDATKPILAVAYYAWDALMMSEMAAALGKTADAEKYMALYEAEKALFQEKYVKDDGKLTIGIQTLCLYALYLDLLPNQESVEAVTNQLVTNIENNGNKLKTGFLGTSIILTTLSKIGRTDLAYKLLLQHNCPSWLYTVDQGATSIWERWDAFTEESGIYGGPASGNAAKSFNHYSFGAVAGWMYRDMAGIGYDTKKPGFKHIILSPKPNVRLKSVDASYESAYGPITSTMSYGENIWNYNCSVPANTTATLYLPVENIETLTINGTAFDPQGEISGITYSGHSNGIAEFELLSGSYEFASAVDNSQSVTIDINAPASVPIDSIEVTLNGEAVASTLPATINVVDGDIITAKITPKNNVDYKVASWTSDGSVVCETPELSYTVDGGENIYLTGNIEYTGYTNLAKGKEVEAEQVRADWSKTYLTDGILNDLGGNRGWSSPVLGKSTTFTEECTAIINLGEKIKLNRFQIYPRTYTVNEGDLMSFPVSYTIYVSDDKTTWKPVYTVEGATPPASMYVPQVVQLNKRISAQYVKLSVSAVTRGDQNGNCYVQLSEFGIYYADDLLPTTDLAKDKPVKAFMNDDTTVFSNTDTTIGDGLASMVDGNDKTFAFIKRHNYSSHLAYIDLGADYDIAKIRLKAPSTADMKAAQTKAGYSETAINTGVCLFVADRIPKISDFNSVNVAAGVTDVIRVNTAGMGISDIDKNFTDIGGKPIGKHRYVGVFAPYSYGMAINSLEVYGVPRVDAEISDNDILITPYEIPSETTLLIAVYKGDVLTECKSVLYDGSPDLTYTPATKYDRVKIFAFENFAELVPLCEAKEL